MLRSGNMDRSQTLQAFRNQTSLFEVEIIWSQDSMRILVELHEMLIDLNRRSACWWKHFDLANLAQLGKNLLCSAVS